MKTFKDLETKATVADVSPLMQIWVEVGKPGSYFYWLLDRWAAWIGAGCPLSPVEPGETPESLKFHPMATDAMTRWSAHNVLGLELAHRFVVNVETANSGRQVEVVGPDGEKSLAPIEASLQPGEEIVRIIQNGRTIFDPFRGLLNA